MKKMYISYIFWYFAIGGGLKFMHYLPSAKVPWRALSPKRMRQDSAVASVRPEAQRHDITTNHKE